MFFIQSYATSSSVLIMMDKRGKRARFMKKSKETVQDALRSRDMLLGSVTRAIEDLDKTINLLGERIEDWYGMYFPELRMDDKMKYCEAALMIDREALDLKELASRFGQKKATDIVTAAEKTLGAKLSKEDMSQCLSLARTIISLDKLRKQYEDYQRELAEELCPNLTEVGGFEIAAKLVSHMGSLYKLAMLPASAVQVIGAEKALFKHLRNRKVPPPKHGIIFQHAKISSAPKKVRGKIARSLANNLCLAAKADAFSKRRISRDLKIKFEERYAEIIKEYEAGKKE